jgi:hypothetical protein
MKSKSCKELRHASCVLLYHGVTAYAPTAEPLEALLLAAEKNMSGHPWSVQVLVQGEKGCKVAGIIRESDFDLTVKTDAGESRQIAIGNQGWSLPIAARLGRRPSPLIRPPHSPVPFPARRDERQFPCRNEANLPVFAMLNLLFCRPREQTAKKSRTDCQSGSGVARVVAGVSAV